MIIKEEKIGNGNHWNVFKVTLSTNNKVRNVIHKRSIHPRAAPRIVKIYESLSQSTMKTLSFLDLYDENTLETENLNSNPDDGYFVSPNTVRSSPHCGSILMKVINKEDVTDQELEFCKDFEFDTLVADSSRINNDKMREKKLIHSEAERFVYDSKINEIANFEEFTKGMLDDLMSASKSKLSLYVDAFFFRVNPVTNILDYKIADFDGIICIIDSDTTVQELFAANKDNFETALHEFIIFFVAEQNQDHYLKMLSDLLS
ncbi:hypothetical protein [Chryseobacterium viscerum]|uniref:Uncharacterized protein n=1 Tax=Chryseobacterium viscerum TaxID=1037377 RepID=A0A316WI57_9FLAO|nr:hypothetical protein [Chryseobacterium viscerum]PWN58130.1 hypothetical protein C1634_024460 [Chryseobacterium viscerum]